MAKRIHDREYNKGEWAELYVFLRLLGTGRLHAADRDLNGKADSFLEVARVFRREAPGALTVYEVCPESGTVKVRRADAKGKAHGMARDAAAASAGLENASCNERVQPSLFACDDALHSQMNPGEAGCGCSDGPRRTVAAFSSDAHAAGRDGCARDVSMEECERIAQVLFSHLVSHEKGAKTMHAPVAVCDFVESIGVANPKAPSMPGRGESFGGKADIVIETRDGRNGLLNRMGFSVKSQFGSPATLFNASPSAPLLYWVAHCDDALMKEFNALRDVRGNRGWFACCQPFFDAHGLRVSFARARNAGSFERNLLFVREGMLEIIAACVRERFIGGAPTSDVAVITASVAEQNPMRYPPAVASAVYKKAMKDFLYAAFSGMSATKPWDGVEQVNGGYIVVKPDGDVLCYHANDREEFREYLFRNTVFEYVSAKKYGWSLIEKSDGEYLLPVNFSIRFKK